MYRSKRLLILLAVLAVVCAAALIALGAEHRQEQIQTSGQVVLELSADSVQTLSWTYGGETLSFTRGEDGGWSYDGDAAFPVDEQAMAELLEPFTAFSAAFVIQDVEDFGQYGLDDPVCTISIGTQSETYEILLGDYSAMDEQRYVSLGDGNVYLAVNDPLDQYDAALRDCIQNDRVPALDQVTSLTFSGAEDYTVFYQEDGSAYSYCEEDVYFTDRDGDTLPLDTSRVESYLSALSNLVLTNYVTYSASDEDLAQYGLDDPELTVSVDYTGEDENGGEISGTFTLHLSRDPEERARAEESREDGSDGEETITAYARVGGSPIVYSITSLEYTDLMAASYDDLRHREVLTADFADIQQIDVTLEGETHTFTAQGSGEDRTWSYQEQEIEMEDLQSAIEDLSADRFTDEDPDQQLEISFTAYLDNENFPQVEVSLYRYDGESCLAVVDGTPVCLIPRGSMVDLAEAVQAIVLQGDSPEES